MAGERARGERKVQHANGTWYWHDEAGRITGKAKPPRRPTAPRGEAGQFAKAKRRSMDRSGRWVWKDERGHFTSPPATGVPGRRRAKRGEVAKRKPSRTKDQKAAGVSRNRMPVGPHAPDTTWDIQNWELLAGDRRVAVPANLRYTRTYFGPNAGRQAAGYLADTGLAASPEYFAVLRSPTSGYVYIFIASGPPSTRNKHRHTTHGRRAVRGGSMFDDEGGEEEF